MRDKWTGRYRSSNLFSCAASRNDFDMWAIWLSRIRTTGIFSPTLGTKHLLNHSIKKLWIDLSLFSCFKKPSYREHHLNTVVVDTGLDINISGSVWPDADMTIDVYYRLVCVSGSFRHNYLFWWIKLSRKPRLFAVVDAAWLMCNLGEGLLKQLKIMI